MPSMCFVMDALDSLHLKKDTTVALIKAAMVRGFDVWLTHQHQLSFIDGVSCGLMRELMYLDFSEGRQDVRWYEQGESELRPLGEIDIVMMRKDPPFNMNYIYTTYLLECAEAEGALIVNKPQSLRDCNEKFFATAFPECTPPLVISAQADQIRAFYQQHGDIILKPLDGMAGQSIFRIKPGDHNLSVVLETLIGAAGRPIMAQLYLPAINDGDKRILLIDGEPVPHALARIPQANEYRANIAAGGIGRAQQLSNRDIFIAESVGPKLKERGLFFVGIDVIGDYLTEVNVTCPTGLRELEAQCDLDIAGALIEQLNKRLNSLA